MAISCQNIENLVQKLGSSSLSTLKKTLASVAKITKRSNEAEVFRKYGGLSGLIALLKRPNNSIIDMSMSSLANCSMFTECKKEVKSSHFKDILFSEAYFMKHVLLIDPFTK